MNVADTLYRRTKVGDQAWRDQSLPFGERTILANLRRAISIDDLREVWPSTEPQPLETVLTLLLQKGWVQQEIQDVDDGFDESNKNNNENVQFSEGVSNSMSYRNDGVDDANHNENHNESSSKNHDSIRIAADPFPEEEIPAPVHTDPESLLIAMGILNKDGAGMGMSSGMNSSKSKSVEKEQEISSGQTIKKTSLSQNFLSSLAQAGAEEAGRKAARERASQKQAENAEKIRQLDEKRKVERSYAAVDHSKSVTGLSERLKRLKEDKKN